jgi:hypothetical protein
MKAKSARKPKKASPPSLLQKEHRNDIVEAIQAGGLDPRHFNLNDSGIEARWKHKWSASCFIIGGGAGHYVGQRIVGDSPVPYEVYSWQSLMERVRTWVQDVKRDLDTPDLWAELQRETKLLGAGSNAVTDNTLFTAEEQKQIAERLRELAEHVSHMHSFSGPQIEALKERLDYLVDASGRLGRKDWHVRIRRLFPSGSAANWEPAEFEPPLSTVGECTAQKAISSLPDRYALAAGE